MREPSQPIVGEHSEHLWATQLCASWPGAPQLPQSLSSVQLAGHLGAQSPPLQVSVDWHWLTSLAVQAPHLWAAGSVG